MTTEDERRVMKLFGLECGECHGITCADAAQYEPSGVPRCDEKCCERCSGTGYSLKEATRENWPWKWGREGETYYLPKGATAIPDGMYLPDFPSDPGASVRLAEEMDAVDLSPGCMKGWVCIYGAFEANAPTLGQALLSALEAADG